MDTEKLWWQKFAEYGEYFERVRPNYQLLNHRSRRIGALFKLELDMYNGGFLQFFCNWGHSAYLLAVEGLQDVGADATKMLLEKCYAVIEPYQEASWDLEKFSDLPELLSEEELSTLDELDQQYWEDADHVMERMLECLGGDAG